MTWQYKLVIERLQLGKNLSNMSERFRWVEVLFQTYQCEGISQKCHENSFLDLHICRCFLLVLHRIVGKQCLAILTCYCWYLCVRVCECASVFNWSVEVCAHTKSFLFFVFVFVDLEWFCTWFGKGLASITLKLFSMATVLKSICLI